MKKKNKKTTPSKKKATTARNPIKKKTVKKAKTVKKSKGKKLGRPKKSPTKPDKSPKLSLKMRIMELRAAEPSLSMREISRRLDCNVSTVSEHLKSEEGQEIEKDLAEATREQMRRLRTNAFTQLEEMLKGAAKLNPRLRFAILKYITEGVVGSIAEESPDEIVFETHITEAGTIEQQQRKVFYKQTSITRSEQKPANMGGGQILGEEEAV